MESASDGLKSNSPLGKTIYLAYGLGSVLIIILVGTLTTNFDFMKHFLLPPVNLFRRWAIVPVSTFAVELMV